MTFDAFLSQFADLSDRELCTLRDSPRVAELPGDPAFYVALAVDGFAGPLQDPMVRQRFIQILRELLYYDGRTFEALLCVAEQEARFPDAFLGCGGSALAGIACYLRDDEPPLPMSVDELISILQRLAESPRLTHNALVCIKKLKEQGLKLQAE